MTAVGEPWTFGFDPGSLPTYLSSRGLRLVEDVSTLDVARRYHRGEQAASFYRIARVEVAAGAEGQ